MILTPILIRLSTASAETVERCQVTSRTSVAACKTACAMIDCSKSYAQMLTFFSKVYVSAAIFGLSRLITRATVYGNPHTVDLSCGDTGNWVLEIDVSFLRAACWPYEKSFLVTMDCIWGSMRDRWFSWYLWDHSQLTSSTRGREEVH